MAKNQLSKEALLASISEKTGAGREMINMVLDGFQDTVKESLSQGQAVQIQKFGTFEISERAARTGRNPATGEQIQIAASKSVKFKPAQDLKDSVNG